MSKQEFMKGILDVANRLNRRVHATYKELVSDWKTDGERGTIDNPVIFHESVKKRGSGYLAEVKTDSEKYRYVDLGTKPHRISPRSENGLLVFPSDFTPRTSVRSLQKRDGGKDWDSPFVFTTHVEEHPGNEGRHFEEPIIEEQIPLVVQDLQDALLSKIRAGLETETIWT